MTEREPNQRERDEPLSFGGPDEVTRLLGDVKDVDPPADLVGTVMSRISSQAPARARSVEPVQLNGGKAMAKKVLWSVMGAAAAVLIVLRMAGYPPPSDGTEGTIGAAQRYQSQQISDSDVKTTDAELQKFLQSDAFHKLSTDKAARQALANKDVQKALADPAVRQALASEEMRLALASDELRQALASEEVRRALASDELRQALASEQIRQALSNEQLRLALSNEQVRMALSNEQIRQALSNDQVRLALTSDQMRQALQSDALIGLLAAPAFDLALRAPDFSAALEATALEADAAKK